MFSKRVRFDFLNWEEQLQTFKIVENDPFPMASNAVIILNTVNAAETQRT